MNIFGSKAEEAKGDGEMFLRIGKGNGGAGAPVTKSCGGGVGAKSVGHRGRAIAVAIENDAKAKIDLVTESGIELSFPPAVGKLFISVLVEKSVPLIGRKIVGDERMVEPS